MSVDNATFSDMRTLLMRNGLWTNQVQHYLVHVVSSCTSCKASATPPPNRQVSLASLNRQLNEVVCVDHFHLDDVTLFHCMDTATRFSAAYVVDSTALDEAVIGFETCWLSQFWPPDAIHADSAFCKGEFAEMLKIYDIKIRAVPPNRHQKNMLEPRHGPIRSIFIRLKNSSPDTSQKILALRAVRISNDLYGSDVISAYEAAKGYTRPVNSEVPPVPVDAELLEAHANLVARRKLTKILRSHSLSEKDFRPGDLVQVYVKRGKEKRGRWLSPRQVISINTDAGMLSVPGAAGRQISVAFEDARAAHVQSEITDMIQESIDKLDNGIEEILSTPDATSYNDQIQNSSQDLSTDHLHINNYDDNEYHISSDNDDENSHISDDEDVSPEPEIVTPPQNDLPSVGDRVEIFWPIDNAFYKGSVSELTPDGKHVIVYDDEDVETIMMSEENWKYESSAHAELGNFTTLPSDEQRVLREIMSVFGNKSFLRHQAQGFEQFPLVNAYLAEETRVYEVCQNCQTF